jgi:hypothetical protein
MVDTPPAVPRQATAAIADQSSGFDIWNGVPGVYKAYRLPSTQQGDQYFIAADAAVLSSAFDSAFPIRAATSAAAVTSTSADLQSVLAVIAEEGEKLGWKAAWRIDQGALTARVPSTQADMVAATTFDLYKSLAKRLGAASLRDVSFDFDIEDE